MLWVLQGTTCGDCVACLLCFPCAACQDARELKKRGGGYADVPPKLVMK